MSADAPPLWEPPLAGTEAEHLTGSLERMRASLRWKADGLDVEQLRARPVPSTELTIGGLLKHLAVCEDTTFSWKLFGEPPTSWVEAPTEDVGTWQFTVQPDESAEQLYRLWEQAVARSRRSLRRALTDGGLDRPSHLEWDGQHASLRRLVLDLVEEYSRHTGHLDLLREAVDGRVGDDPPWDWPTLPAEEPAGPSRATH